MILKKELNPILNFKLHFGICFRKEFLALWHFNLGVLAAQKVSQFPHVNLGQDSLSGEG